jgi:DNA polymerase III subunit beta
MRFTCLQENLKQGLFMVSHVAGKNVNLPILNNTLITAKNGDITLVATDLEIGITSKIRGKIEEEGAFTVDSRIINDYVVLLPNKKMDLKEKDLSLLVECDNYKTKIKGLSADEFPLIPTVEKKSSFTIENQELKRALEQVLFSVSSSDARLELTGVYFEINGSELTLAATDSYRLAEKRISLDAAADKNNKQTAIVPGKTLLELNRIIGANRSGEEGGEKIKCYLAENQVLFASGTTEIVSRLIEGQYPDYRQIIPQKTQTAAVLNRAELLRAVKAASLFSKTGINDINLDFPAGQNKVVITAASGQTGENTTELAASVNGKDNGVVVNYRYLLDGLNNCDSDDIRLEIVDSNTPCLVKPEGVPGYVYIIMPIKQ